MKSKKIREFLWQHLKTHASNVHEEFDGDISLYTMTREIEEVPEHIIGSVMRRTFGKPPQINAFI